MQVLFEQDGLPRSDMPDALEALYGGGLGFDSPRLFANFVSSIDGVVALEAPGTGSGAAISGRSQADRFLLGLLRAFADVVLLGAGTLRAERRHRWTPADVYPAAADAFAELRRRLGKPEEPRLVVVTRRAGPELASLPSQPLLVGGEGRLVDLAALVHDLRQQGYRDVLTEGGPTLMGELVAAGLVDELFLTMSPVLAGRPDSDRLGLVRGIRLLPEAGRWASLMSVRTSGSHLFLRYGLQ